MATQISPVKRKRKSIEIEGVAQLRARIGDLLSTKVAVEEFNKVSAEAARILYSEVLSNARSVNVPHEVLEDVFIYSKMPASWAKEKGLRSSLVGLRKAGRYHNAHGYVTWRPGRRVGRYSKTQRSKTRSSKEGKSLVRPGAVDRIGENLGTMWELGTTLMRARPWFRPAVTAVKAAVVEKIATGYWSVIERFARRRAA